jgi:hypothetical protein
MTDGSAPTITVRYDGVDYVLGEDATLCRGFSWKSDEVKGEIRNLIFVLAVLGHVGMTDAEIMVGLPVSTFDREKERIKNLFSGQKEAVINGVPTIFNIFTWVTREPLGSYFALVLNHDGNTDRLSPYFRKLTAIVDIGYRTVDIVTMSQGRMTESRKSSLSGTTMIFDRLWALLEKDHGMLKANEIVELYNQITRGNSTPMIKGLPSPSVGEHLRVLKAELAQEITDFVSSVLSELAPSITVFTGGGALFLKDELQALNRNITFHPNSRYANAIGFYRLIEKVNNAANKEHITQV